MEISWNLPRPVLCSIFQYLTLSNLAKAARVCKVWNSVSNCDALWSVKSYDDLRLTEVDPGFSWKEWYRLLSKKTFNFTQFHLLGSRIILVWEKSFCFDETSTCQTQGVQEKRTICTNHSFNITSTHVSASQTVIRFFTGSYDRSIKFWTIDPDSGSFEHKQTLTHHKGTITSFASGDRWLFSGSTDRTVGVWSFDKTLQQFSFHQSLIGHLRCIKAIRTNRDRDNPILFTGSNDDTIKIWKNNDDSFEEIQTLKYHRAPVTTLEYVDSTEKKNQLMSGDENGVVCIWQEQANRLWGCLRTIQAHANPIAAIRYNYPQQSFCTGGGNEIKLWKLSKRGKDWEQAKVSQIANILVCEIKLGDHRGYVESGELYLLTEKELHISWIDKDGIKTTDKTIEFPHDNLL